jgi:hypothetical protein
MLRQVELRSPERGSAWIGATRRSISLVFYRWFERETDHPFFRTVYGFRTDKLNVPDDFEVPGIE